MQNPNESGEALRKLISNENDHRSSYNHINNQSQENQNAYLSESERKFTPDESSAEDLSYLPEIYFDTYFFIRTFLIFLGITLICLNTVYGFIMPQNDIPCLVDMLHVVTNGLNQYFLKNIGVRNAMLIFSSFCIDFSALFMAFNWALRGNSWRIVFVLFIFYSLRGIVQVISFYL